MCFVVYMLCVCVCCSLPVAMLYVSLGSRVSPSIFGLMFMGSVMLSICVVQIVCCILLGLV